MLKLKHLTAVLFVKFSHHKVILLLSQCCALREEITLLITQVRRGDSRPHSGAEHHRNIRNSAQEIRLFLPIYLFRIFFISVWIYGYLFCTLHYNPVNTTISILLYKLFQLWTLRTSSWLLCPFDQTHRVCVTFLLSGIIRCSRLILCISYSGPRISHFCKEPCY